MFCKTLVKQSRLTNAYQKESDTVLNYVAKFKTNYMKKIILAALVLLLGTGIGFAQQAPAKTTQDKAKHAKKEATAVKPKSSTSEQHVASAATSTSSTHLKKDGTPDKRYKQNKHLKKDGTPDKRFKSNKQQ